MQKPQINVRHLERDLAISGLNDRAWENAENVPIDRYWSGADAPSGRHFTASLLWSDMALYVRFDAALSEPLVVNEKPDIRTKALGLWNRDVCEIFVAPDPKFRNRYFEFEIAPTGEWIDIGITHTDQDRFVDRDYASNMESAARIDADNVVMAMKIPWAAFRRKPETGDIWLGNLFRCVGKDPNRGYLAWQPTKTERPNFHVPSEFGEFEFVKGGED